MKRKIIKQYIWLIAYLIFIIISYLVGFNPGREIALSFKNFLIEMVSFIPLIFIVVGLFDVWFPQERIEKHIGKESGIKGIFWVVILATLQAGPLYAAFPVAYFLWKKGCSIKNIFIYLGAFSTLKIPMLTFEIGFLGLKFSILRTIITLPVFILIGNIMEFYLKNKNFEVKEVN